jgi:DeoR/GlpR family transcriptional regulator of sugar metabolism
MIVDIVEKQNSVSVGDLCERFDVSDMTIRRDLRMLHNEGLIERVHGGAVARRGRSYEPPFRIREETNPEAKKAIAREAYHLIQEGDSLALDVGTTTLFLAEELVGMPNLTIITSSLYIANVLADAPNMRLILSGGILREGENSMVGFVAERTYSDFHVDKTLIGIAGVNPDNGLTEYNLEDALVKKAMIQNSDQKIILADSTKFGRTVFTQVAPLSEVDIIITDSDAPKDVIEELRNEGIKVIVAQKE